MNVVERNQLYLKGIYEENELFPRLEVSPASGFFNWDFGLPELPREPGVIIIRGPRQYGKSTWLEYQLRETLRQFGPGTALFLNGDYIAGPDEFEREIESLSSHFPTEAVVPKHPTRVGRIEHLRDQPSEAVSRVSVREGSTPSNTAPDATATIKPLMKAAFQAW
jgi:hypothetical protein